MWEKNKQKKNKPARPPESPDTSNAPQGDLSAKLEDNINLFKNLFQDVDIMLSREFANQDNPGLSYCIFYSDGVVDSMMINQHIIMPLLLSEDLTPGSKLFGNVKQRFVMMNDVRESDNVQEIIEAITYGDTLLLIDGCSKGLIMSSKSFSLRSIAEPDGEKVLSGPREGFTEGIMMNLSMIRRRMRTNQLKIKFQTLGRQTHTTICVCYMDNIVNKKILNELYRRLNAIDIDGIMDSNYITEYIAERSFIGFSTVGNTERPDVVAAKLLEGRIALLVDGSPIVLTLPFLFIENFQSNEDYYQQYVYSTFSRMLRILGFILTITIPAVYIAIVTHHHEIMPTSLLVNMSAERSSVPLPAALECFTMLLIFDILRETGVRMPSHVGQAMSIVGALVIGQAAVEAKLVASPMIIVVALTGITNLLVSKCSGPTLISRYSLLLLSTNFGLSGIFIGMAILCGHLFELNSFGVPHVLPWEHLQFQEVKDSFVRVPWPHMLQRTSPFTGNLTRAKKHSTMK